MQLSYATIVQQNKMLNIKHLQGSIFASFLAHFQKLVFSLRNKSKHLRTFSQNTL